MYLVREIFHCKPAQAKELVKIFKKMMEEMPPDDNFSNPKVMTDSCATFWTVVFESEAKSLDKFMDMLHSGPPPASAELQEMFKKYHDYVTGGHREIWKIE